MILELRNPSAETGGAGLVVRVQQGGSILMGAQEGKGVPERERERERAREDAMMAQGLW